MARRRQSSQTIDVDAYYAHLTVLAMCHDTDVWEDTIKRLRSYQPVIVPAESLTDPGFRGTPTALVRIDPDGTVTPAKDGIR